MNVSTALFATAAAIAIGMQAPTGHTPRPQSPDAAFAWVRFGNQLTANRSATLKVNGIVLFDNVAARTMTEYVAQADSVVMFTVHVGVDTNAVGTKEIMVSGGYYSVIALNGGDNRPTITVRRDSVKRTP